MGDHPSNIRLTEPQAQALQRLLDVHWRALRKWAWRLARRTNDDVDDVLALGLLKISISFPTYDPRRSSFLTWAGLVMYHAWANERRRRARVIQALDADEQWLCEQPWPGSAVADQVAASLFADQVLRQLRPDQQWLLRRLAQGWSQSELARALGLTKVSIHHRRALAVQAAARVAKREGVLG